MSLRDVAEFFLLRGFEFTHEAVRDWEERFAPIFAQQLRAKRKGYYPTLGFGAFESALRFCQAFDEVRNYFRPRHRRADIFISGGTCLGKRVSSVPCDSWGCGMWVN